VAGGVVAVERGDRRHTMSWVLRILGALPVAAAALLPIAAAAIPIPSPSLAQVLLPPPSGYTEVGASAPFHGQFNSQVYAAAWGTKAADAQKALDENGFVDAYGTFLVNQLDKHVLVEYVVAFAGGNGARSWLSYTEAGDKLDPTFRHADTISGIDPYFGEHNVYPSHDVSDAFDFVKGNDYFVIGFQSTRDDVLALATSRAKSQFDSAPGSTIPPAQWPENASTTPSDTPAFDVGRLLGELAILAVIFGVIAAIVFQVMRSGRRAVIAEGPAWAQLDPSREPAVPAGAVGATPLQMSPDGAFWWDGQTWRDGQGEVPPMAQRSADGAFWWDGQKWRAVS